MSTIDPEEARRILQERRKNDPLYAWKPAGTQSLYFNSRMRVRLIEGANRTGKTTVNIADFAAVMRNMHPVRAFKRPVKLLFLVKSRVQCANIIGARLFDACDLHGPGVDEKLRGEPFIPAREIEGGKPGTMSVAGQPVPYNLVMKNGNRARFAWSDQKSVVDKIQGENYDGVYGDEDAGDLALYLELISRLQDSRSEYLDHGDIGGYVSWSATPEKHSETLLSIRDACKAGKAGHERFHIERGENPAIDDRVIEEWADQLGEMASVKVHGNKTVGDLFAAYADFWSEERHMMKEDYVVQPSDNLWLSYDPGAAHLTGMAFAAINQAEPRTLRFVKCLLPRKTTPQQDAKMVADFLGGRHLAGVVYDHEAKKVHKTGLNQQISTLSVFQDAMRDLGCWPLGGFFAASKQHVPGVEMVRHYLDPVPVDKTAPPLIRLNPSQESGCLRMREQILRVQMKKKPKAVGQRVDVSLLRGDDEMTDVLRYLAMKRPAWNPLWSCGMRTEVAKAVAEEARAQLTPEEQNFLRLKELSDKATRNRSTRSAHWRPVIFT